MALSGGPPSGSVGMADVSTSQLYRGKMPWLDAFLSGNPFTSLRSSVAPPAGHHPPSQQQLRPEDPRTRRKVASRQKMEERQKERRKLEDKLFSQLDELVPGNGTTPSQLRSQNVPCYRKDIFAVATRLKKRCCAIGLSQRTATGVGRGFRRSLKSGRTKEELLVAAALYLRKFRPSDRAKLAGSRCFGLVAVHLGSNQIIHANERFGKLGDHVYPSGLQDQFLRPILHENDCECFQRFANQVLLDLNCAIEDKECSAEEYAHVTGRSLDLRFCTRPAQGATTIRSPPWLLTISPPVKFTLCKVVWAKPSGPLQGGTVGIFVVDIGAAQQSRTEIGICAAHVRNMVESQMLNRTYKACTIRGGLDPGQAVLYMTSGEAIPMSCSPTRWSVSNFMQTLQRKIVGGASWLAMRWGPKSCAWLHWSWELSGDDDLQVAHLLEFEMAGARRFSLSYKISLGVERVREMPFEKGRKGRERLFIVVDPEEPLTPKISGRDFWVYDVAVSGEVCPTNFVDFKWGPREYKKRIMLPWYDGGNCAVLEVFGVAQSGAMPTAEAILSRALHRKQGTDEADKGLHCQQKPVRVRRETHMSLDSESNSE